MKRVWGQGAFCRKGAGRRGVLGLAAAICCLLLAACGKEEAQPPAAQGQWNGISSYVEAQRAACREATYYSAKKDGSVGQETTAAVTATKLLHMDKQGEVTGLDDAGVLEVWEYAFLVKLDVKDVSAVALVGGQYYDEEGYFDLGRARRILVALRYPDGSYDILHDAPADDGMDFYGYAYTAEEAVYDWYVREKGLDLPLYTGDWEGLGQGSNFPVHRYDGEGFYLYLPTDAWYWAEPDAAAGARWEWYSAYGSGSSLTIRHLDASAPESARQLQDRGFTAAGGAYWRYDRGDRHERCRVVTDSRGGSYLLSSRWSDSGLTVAAGAADEAQVLEKMLESFTPETLEGKAVAAGAATQCKSAAFFDVTETAGGETCTAKLELRLTVRQGDAGTYIQAVSDVLIRNVSGWAAVSLAGEVDTEKVTYAKDRRSAIVPMTYFAKETAAAEKFTSYSVTVRLGVENLVREDADALTAAELEEFDRLLDPVNGAGGVNPFACFLTSEYDDVREMDFAAFLMYFPPQEAAEPLTEAELEALKALPAWSFGPDVTLETMPVPVRRIAAGDIDAVLTEYAGIGLRDLKDTAGVDYLEAYDSYYTYASDAGFGIFRCASGRREGDLVCLYAGELLWPDADSDGQGLRQKLTLRQTESGQYQVVSLQREAGD